MSTWSLYVAGRYVSTDAVEGDTPERVTARLLEALKREPEPSTAFTVTTKYTSSGPDSA